MQILRKTNLKALEKARKLGPEGVIKLIKEKALAGRGGASYPAGMKWEMARAVPSDERFLICNADEGEPGTFKDRMIIEKNPETLAEGIIIAAETIGAKKAYVYLRGEYECLRESLQKAVESAAKKSKTNVGIEIFLGAGAYVCGDETAIISSIEGTRGQPRPKPPFPTVSGLFGKPTVINNAETLANVPLAILYDDWSAGLRLHCISGDVAKPGVYELPLGTKLSEIMSMAEPRNKVKAVYFGCFGGCIPYEGNESMPLTHENVCRGECLLGALSLIVADETRSIVDLAANIAKFYDFESCGKCTPCREGTMRMLNMLENISLGSAKPGDIKIMEDLAEVMRDTSFCGLGQTSSHHILTALKYFRSEFEAKVKNKQG